MATVVATNGGHSEAKSACPQGTAQGPSQLDTSDNKQQESPFATVRNFIETPANSAYPTSKHQQTLSASNGDEQNQGCDVSGGVIATIGRPEVPIKIEQESRDIKQA